MTKTRLNPRYVAQANQAPPGPPPGGITVVQTAVNAALGTSVTATFAAPTTTGNYVIAVASQDSTTGQGSVNFTSALGSHALTALVRSVSGSFGANQFVSELPNVPGTDTAVTITTTGGSGTQGIMLSVYEVAGLGTVSGFDQQAIANPPGSATTWSSGATPTTTAVSELWIGQGTILALTGTPSTIGGPSSPWTNLAAQPLSFTSLSETQISGWQVVSSAGTATYSGTASPTSFSSSLVVTFK